MPELQNENYKCPSQPKGCKNVFFMLGFSSKDPTYEKTKASEDKIQN